MREHCYNKGHMKMHMKDHYQGTGKKVAFGVVLLAAGALLLAYNFDLFPQRVFDIVFSWPMILVTLGFINLYSRQSIVAGVILLLVGSFFLLPHIFAFDFNFVKLLWPAMLIFIGIMLIFRRSVNCKAHAHINATFEQTETTNTVEEDHYINEINVFSGTKKALAINNFKGGKITCIFGGGEYDLRNCMMSPGRNYIEITAIFGGATIVLPSDWHVRVDMFSLFGGFEDKRYNYNNNSDSAETMLVIKGTAIFGGGEIKYI
jgi:predicted membrane protein